MNDMVIQELYERSNNDIAVSLGKRFKDYRIALRLTQKEIATQSGVSLMTIVRFENGHATSIGLDHFIALMRALQCLDRIADAVPETPSSLYAQKAGSIKAKERVKRRKDEE